MVFFLLNAFKYTFTASICFGRMEYKVNFKAGYSCFQFRVFLLQTGCLTKATKPGLPYYLPIGEEEEIDPHFSRCHLCLVKLQWSFNTVLRVYFLMK